MTGSREPIFLFGVGGHGRSVFEVIERQGLYDVVVVLDDSAPAGTSFRGVRISGGREAFPSLRGDGVARGFIAVGDNADRERLSTCAHECQLALATLVDPAAHIARDVSVGAGTVVMPGVVVSVGARIGGHAILNTGCTVDHDSVVLDYAHVSPGAHISGECEIGVGSHVGIGASVVQCIRIGEGARIGAGAAVVEDVAAGAVVVGVPARPIDANTREGGRTSS
jgi:sugar O-acyltransferase (sialic acid O-acetyltransferase NeuD family)